MTTLLMIKDQYYKKTFIDFNNLKNLKVGSSVVDLKKITKEEYKKISLQNKLNKIEIKIKERK